jgi:hypothetical protein
MKFRETFKTKMYESYVAPLVLGLGFYIAAPKMLRLYVHRHIYYRTYKLLFAFNFGTMSYMYLNTKIWPSKTIHELITQPEPNGKYVRSVLKNQFPRNWSQISKQLHESGYNFKEMNEYSENVHMPDVTYKWDDSRY